MRIIGGKYKGRRLKSIKNLKARPTTDFAKEALFNILNNNFDFEEITVLDLFSGTGGIAFEFLSRGALQVDIVESDRVHLSAIVENLKELNITNVKTVKGDVFKIVPKLKVKYDIIFADPPYIHEKVSDLPMLIFEKELLKSEGWFILEHSEKYNFNEHQYFKELRRYGSVHFSIFQAKNIP